MPYIKPEQRYNLNPHPERNAMIGGELNYQISVLVTNFFAMRGLSYSVINEVIGALECAKLEAYRRIASPYEDKKVVENGEVYTIL